MEKHIISIHEVDINNSQHCHVMISIDGVPLSEVREIRDPFERTSHHDVVRQYIDKSLDPGYSGPTSVQPYIEKYRNDLFDSLELKNSLMGLPHSAIEINLCVYARDHVDASSSISLLEFYFELLELMPHESHDIWPPSISTVLVQRVILNRPFFESDLLCRSIPQTVPWSDFLHSASPFPPSPTKCRVLLVIARDLTKGSNDLNPSLIECILLRLFERLNEIIQMSFYQLEVVRPGSFAELKSRLESTKHDPFQLVHFDMHGQVPDVHWSIDGNGKPCQPYQATLSFVGKKYPAKEIASLLYANNVQCVALNACESARADRGAGGNLSYTFLRQGIPNVVAMSFRASEMMSVKYYISFYEKLFEPKSSFSLAASHARLGLCRDRERTALIHEMTDWFVPVFYCNERIAQMPVPGGLESSIVPGDTVYKREKRRLRSTKATTSIWITTAATVAAITRYAIHAYRYDYLSLFFCLLIVLAVTVWILIISLSLRCSRHPAARDLEFNKLGINVPAIEEKLKDHRFLFLYGLANQDTHGAFTVIDNLNFVWSETRFADLVVVLNCVWFGQTALIRVLRHWYCSLIHNSDCCQGEKLLENHVHPSEKVIVIITNLEYLFPSKPSMLSRWLKRALCEISRRRFIEFLERYLKNKDVSTEANNYGVTSSDGERYLFLSTSADLKDSEKASKTKRKQASEKKRKQTFEETPEEFRDIVRKLKSARVRLLRYEEEASTYIERVDHIQRYVNQR